MERDKGDTERVVAKVEKFSGHTWCFCNWLLTCFKKDEPAIGAATFEGETPPTPEQQTYKYLLPPRRTGDVKKCIIIDLDETLVHSSFKVS